MLRLGPVPNFTWRITWKILSPKLNEYELMMEVTSGSDGMTRYSIISYLVYFDRIYTKEKSAKWILYQSNTSRWSYKIQPPNSCLMWKACAMATRMKPKRLLGGNLHGSEWRHNIFFGQLAPISRPNHNCLCIKQRSEHDQVTRWRKSLRLSLARWHYDASDKPALIIGDWNGQQPLSSYILQFLVTTIVYRYHILEILAVINWGFLRKKALHCNINTVESVAWNVSDQNP